VPQSAVEVRGGRELAFGFARVSAEIGQEVRQLEHGAAVIVVPIAKTLAPYKSGALSGAIRIAGTMGNGIAFGGPLAPHGPVVNFGGTIPRAGTTDRTRVRSQEHIYRAIELGEPILMQMMAQGVSREIERRL
jgi:hypothetical protein